MLNDYGKCFLYYCDSQDTVRHDDDFIQTKATWLSVDFTRKKRQVLYRNLDLQVLQRAAISLLRYGSLWLCRQPMFCLFGDLSQAVSRDSGGAITQLSAIGD